MGATHAEKSTVKAGSLNAVSSAMASGGVSAMEVAAAQAQAQLASQPATDMKFCSIDNPDCEACQ